jgi:hypothetical protein
VRTARELFDMMNGARGQAFQRLSEQFGFPGSASAPGPGQPADPAQSASEGWSAAGGQSASAGGAPGQGQAPGYGQFAGGGNHFPAQDYFGQSASQGGSASEAQSASQGWQAAEGQPAPGGQEQPPAPGQFPGQGQPPNQGQPAGGNQPPGQGQFPWRRRRKGDDDYDHYNVEGSDPRLGGNRNGRDFDLFSGDNIADDIGGAVMGAALGFAGRAIGRRMMKAFEDKVVPAVQARASQFEQQKGEQDAIAARYPELRGCTKDQVIFLDGGMRTVPVSELRMPVTLAQADQVVARLR